MASKKEFRNQDGNSELFYYLNERKCRVCGRIFAPSTWWVYKDGRTLVCSYKCMRTAQRREAGLPLREDHIRAKCGLSYRGVDDAHRMMCAGKTDPEIAAYFGVPENSILRLRQRFMKEGSLE